MITTRRIAASLVALFLAIMPLVAHDRGRQTGVVRERMQLRVCETDLFVQPKATSTGIELLLALHRVGAAVTRL